MECPKCGYVMEEGQQDCPRCRRLGDAAATGRLSGARQGAGGWRLLLLFLIFFGLFIFWVFHSVGIEYAMSIFTGPRYLPACNYLYTGVTLYAGPRHQPYGVVLGGDDKHLDMSTMQRQPYIRIQFASREEVWMKRADIEKDEYYVRTDELAFKRTLKTIHE